MREFLMHLRRHGDEGLQNQLRRHIADAVLNGQLAAGEAMPSSRLLAKQLGIARNTVVLAYQGLVEQGYLIARERSGFYVNGEMALNNDFTVARADDGKAVERLDWSSRLDHRFSSQVRIRKPANWRDLPYPFIYGQQDPALFPLAAWRQCSRDALGRLAVDEWASDQFRSDDPLLIDQIRTRVLPRRGVSAGRDEILITMGAQNALWITSNLLLTPDKTIGVEDPGYVDARNMFSLRTKNVKSLAIDEGGLIIGDHLRELDYLYVTPSHQSPTTVTLPLERREVLMALAEENDVVLIEDDYEGETNFLGRPTPALKSLDRSGRVIYVGSLSKHLAPGIRLGYVVASAELIVEMRHLRHLVLRHPPSNNQHCLALFLANGHYDGLIRRLHKRYRERWQIMADALDKHLPHTSHPPTFGGSSFWLQGPPGLDADRLAEAALGEGVVIEPGTVHFYGPDAPKNFMRLGFSSIQADRIEPGIEILAKLMDQQLNAK